MVERGFVGMENDRRFCRDNELTFNSVEGIVKTAAIKLLPNKI